MKSRPILFTGEMVRALLAGTKTQTRRIIKPQPPIGVKVQFAPIYCGPDMENDPRPMLAWRIPGWMDVKTRLCPYGQIGDQLWVRETWCRLTEIEPSPGSEECQTKTYYAATETEPVMLCDGDGFSATRKDGGERSPWKPSIHMPRALSRISLEITDVRVQRLQEISEGDAKAEGCTETQITEWRGRPDPSMKWGSHRESYRKLWDEINGSGGWDLDPWVWALTLRRVTP